MRYCSCDSFQHIRRKICLISPTALIKLLADCLHRAFHWILLLGVVTAPQQLNVRHRRNGHHKSQILTSVAKIGRVLVMRLLNSISDKASHDQSQSIWLVSFFKNWVLATVLTELLPNCFTKYCHAPSLLL